MKIGILTILKWKRKDVSEWHSTVVIKKWMKNTVILSILVESQVNYWNRTELVCTVLRKKWTSFDPYSIKSDQRSEELANNWFSLPDRGTAVQPYPGRSKDGDDLLFW